MREPPVTSGEREPERMEEHLEALVRRILHAAGPELARLRRRGSVGGQVEAWARPLLPLAALLILVFGLLLTWHGSGEAESPSETPLMAEVLVPEPVVLWLEAGARFTMDEIVLALEGGGP